MRSCRIPIWLALIAINAFVFASANASTADFNTLIKQRLSSSSYPLRVGKERLKAVKWVDQFYAARGYEPAWIDADGPTQNAVDLSAAIADAKKDGLDPNIYHQAALNKLLGQVKSRPRTDAERSSSADIEILLTDAFFYLGSHMLNGRIAPETVTPDWVGAHRQRDLLATLNHGLASRAVPQMLQSLAPSHMGYVRLRDALARLRATAAQISWPVVAEGPKIKPGESSPRIKVIQQRLEAAGYVAHQTETAIYNSALVEAVKRFQSQHGLESDGVIGRGTVAALNTSLQQRIRQIELNMERWRWLPDNFGNRYIFVNVADFSLSLFDNNTNPLNMRVVAGRPTRQTPVFSKEISYLVLNPYWEVPPRIANQDIVDHITEEPDYLVKNNIKIYNDWEDGEEIDPATLNWDEIKSTHQLPFRLRQEPGEHNALGQVKFMLPNMFNVYLHDTPSKKLFNKTTRAFSSGCVRLQKPLDLLAYIMRDQPKWTPEKISAALATGKEKIINLNYRWPVHVVYLTAWVNESDNTVEFRPDVYQRDARQATAIGALRL